MLLKYSQWMKQSYRFVSSKMKTTANQKYSLRLKGQDSLTLLRNIHNIFKNAPSSEELYEGSTEYEISVIQKKSTGITLQKKFLCVTGKISYCECWIFIQ